MTPNETAFLEVIAHSELGAKILANSDNGYNVLVGSTPDSIDTFASYATHPNKLQHISNSHGLVIDSTAAGRYQLLHRYFISYAKLLKLPDFGKLSQCAIALQQLKEKGALIVLNGGDFNHAISIANTIWASLPGSPYGQHENDYAALLYIYQHAGGALK